MSEQAERDYAREEDGCREIGMLSGLISGVLGIALGGPVGCGVAGFVGPAAVMYLIFGENGGVRSALATGAVLGLSGALAGLALGAHLRGPLPRMPGAEWLADGIYGSPPGGWLGWRRQSQGIPSQPSA